MNKKQRDRAIELTEKARAELRRTRAWGVCYCGEMLYPDEDSIEHVRNCHAMELAVFNARPIAEVYKLAVSNSAKTD